MTKKELNELWATLSRKVLASVLVDDGAVFPAQDIIGKQASFFSPKERPIWQVILLCLSENTPPTVEAVKARLNGNVPAGYVESVAGLFNDDDNRRLIYNVEQLRDIGILMQLQHVGTDLAGLDNIQDISKTVDTVITRIGGILAGKNSRKSDAASVSESAWAKIEKTPELSIPTGLKWFDDLAGGLWLGMNYWFVAPYKSGKSTLMRNLVLHAANYNNPVGVFCAEGSRELFVLDCQAMLATAILADKGWRREQLRLSGLFIRRFYWQTGVWKKDELDAIHEAREIWKHMPVHIWDTGDGIRDLATLRYLVKRGRVHDGITSFWADYSQLFGEGRTIYDRQSTTALTIQDISQSENVAFCMLAQQNEAQIGSRGEGYSPGIKGGGEGAAAADFLFIPKIDVEFPVLNITLKHSRHTAPGSGDHYLQQSSGLIMDRWIKIDT